MKTIPKLSELIQEKKFDYVNPNITDTLFEIPKEISSDYKLYYFGRYISSENIVIEMKKDGYRPANVWELLKWKDWDNKDWVIALGSVGEVYGCRHVPYLGGFGSRCYLDLAWWGSGCSSSGRFLAVRNSSLNSLDSQSSKLSNLDTLTLNKLDQLEDSMMNGYLRDQFEEIFEKDQEAIDGIRPSKSNRSGALLLWAEIIKEIRKLK